MKKFKYILLILLSVLVVSCSSKNNNGGGVYEPGYSDGEKDEAGNLGDNNIVTPEGHKIIYTVEYGIKVEDSITSTVRAVNSQVYTLGGYVSSSNESGTYATYVYKVPSSKLNDFLDGVDALEGVSSKKISSQDVTTSYNDLQAEIEVLEASRLAYVKMLEKDGLSMNEVITLNDKIRSIDVSLKKLYKSLDNYNSLIDYATITINYSVYYTVKPKGFLSDYGEFLLDLGKFIVSFVVYTAPFALIAGAGVGVVSLVKKSKKKESK